MSRRRSRTGRAGTALSEIAVVVATLVIVAGAMLPRLEHRAARARDERRVAEAFAIQRAIETYRADLGVYPPARPLAAAGGWDASSVDGFLDVLVERGYLSGAPRDPLDEPGFEYRYRVHAQGAEGCEGAGPFYVLGVRAFETAEASPAHRAALKCGARDWTAGLAWATGGGARFEK